MGIVHYAWEQSFARVETNKKATAARGWNPLTYSLLDNKDLKREKASNPVKAAYEMCMISGKAAADPLTLNFNEGYSATPWIRLYLIKLGSRHWTQQELKMQQKLQDSGRKSSNGAPR